MQDMEVLLARMLDCCKRHGEDKCDKCPFMGDYTLEQATLRFFTNLPTKKVSGPACRLIRTLIEQVNADWDDDGNTTIIDGVVTDIVDGTVKGDFGPNEPKSLPPHGTH